MGRAGYNEGADDNWSYIMWRGAVTSAIKGARGQAFLRELIAALDAMPNQRLVAEELEARGEVCALGAVGKARSMEMGRVDPEDYSTVAGVFGISEALAREIAFENDEGGYRAETPEWRWVRMRRWAASRIKPDAGAAT